MTEKHATGLASNDIVGLPVKVVTLVKTCDSCPAQWEGQTDDGRALYVRYRWGWLTVSVSEEPSDDVLDAVHGPEIFSAQLGEEFDGSLSDAQLWEATQSVVQYPAKALQPNGGVDAAARNYVTRKFSLTSPLARLASNDLFARP